MGALVVIDYWEKLAGASLALSAIIRLCQHTGLSLVAPAVRSSLFVPTGGWPLSAYYDLSAIATVLAPQQLVDFAMWTRLRQRAANTSINVAVIYRDFPAACLSAMSSHRTQRANRSPCPSACLAASGLRRQIAAAEQRWLPVADLPWHCVSASAVHAAIEGSGGAFAELLSHSSAVALLNFRRHDSGRPMLPPAQALQLRAAAVRPAPAIRAAARSFLRTHALPPEYTLVQLRSNHLAHSAFVAAGGAATAKASANSVHASAVTQKNCTRRVTSCVRRLGRATRRLAPPAATVVASDLSTLFEANQARMPPHPPDSACT